MKNLFLLLLFPAFFAGAQHYAWQTEFNAQVTALVPLPNGHWFLGGSENDAAWFFSNGYVAETATDGAFFSAQETKVLDRTLISSVIPLPDGRWVQAGFSHVCDFDVGGFVQLLDVPGTVLWTMGGLQQWPNEFIPEISDVLLTPNQEILAVGGDIIWRIDLETGQVLEKKKLPGSDISDLSHTSDGKGYLLAAGNAIIAMDSALNTAVLHTIPEAGKSYTRVIAAPNSGFLALRNDNKIQYRRWIGVGFNWMILEPGFNVTDIEPAGHGAVLCGVKDGKGWFGSIIDTSAQVETAIFTLSQPDLRPHQIGFDPVGGGFVLAGVELHGPSPRTYLSQYSGNQHFWIQSFAPDGTTQNAACDAALVELVVHQLPKASPHNGPPWSPLKWQIYLNGEFSVRLKNTGVDTLHSVHVLAARFSLSDPGYCPLKQYINKRFEQLDLAPGADTLLYLGFFGWGYAETVMPWDICIWTTAPNDQIDINHDNDYVCGEFNLVSATHEQKTAAVELFPNPAQDALFLQTNGETPGLCRIFNAAGRLVAEQTPVSGPEAWRLDVSRLPAGFYWLQTEHGQGRFVKM